MPVRSALGGATFGDGQPGISGTFKSVPSTIRYALKDEMNPRWFGYKGGKHELIRSFHCGYKFFSIPGMAQQCQ